MRFRHAALRSPLSALRDFRRPARLALPAFFALTLTLGLAGPLWAAGNVSNLHLTASNGIAITDDYPSALAFTPGSHSAGYTLQSVTLKLASAGEGSYNASVTLIVAIRFQAEIRALPWQRCPAAAVELQVLC